MPSPSISRPEISQVECYFEKQKDPGNLPGLNFFHNSQVVWSGNQT